MGGGTTPHSLEAEIEAISRLGRGDRKELVTRWTALFGKKPPPTLPPSILAMSLAYELQARKYGGLKASTRRRLLEAAKQDAPSQTDSRLRPGTVLVREWHGVTHKVTILDQGVSYDGKLYRSLTHVAGAITGNHWSGPVFFGLRSKRLVTTSD